MSKVIYCPHLTTLDGMTWYCMKGTFPVNCETCNEPNKSYVEVYSSTNSEMIEICGLLRKE